ncbi:MAG: TonB-dependent receptor [bacterium]|nr:TonB-dependent receptor [bacterium]
MVSPAPLAWGVPSTGLGLGLSGFGEQVNGPFVQSSHIFQWVDNLSVIRGNHSLKFGGEYRRDRFNEAGVPFQRGSFSFNGVATEDPANRGRTGHPMADILIGMPRRSQRSRVPSNGLLRAPAAALYAEDTWKVTNTLTLNLGLRYEYTPPYHDKYRGAMNVLFFDHGVTPDVRVNPDSQVPLMVRTGSGDFHEGLSYHWHDGVPTASSGDGVLPRALMATDKNDFAPRIGIAWRATDKTTIRTGFGVFYIQDIGEIRYDLARNIAGRSDFIADRERQNADIGDPWRVERENFVCSNWDGDCQGPTFTLAVNTNRRTPYSLQWMFNVQQQLDDNTTLEAGYLGTGGHKLERLVLWNQAVHRAGSDDASSIVSRRPWGDSYGLIQTSDNVVNSNYHAASFKLRRRSSGGLTYLVGYTWGKSIDGGSGIRVRGGEEEQAAFAYDLANERALSQFHTPHRLVGSILWEIPVGRNQVGARGKILGGWQLGSILTFSAGTPLSVGRIGDRNNTGAGTRPDATGISPFPDNPTPEKLWNIEAFSDKSPELLVREGTAGRGVLRRPGVSQWDFSVTKNTRITESQTLQFRFEAFNFTNHPNWNPGGRNPRSAATFGKVTSARTMRELQLGLKYIF